MNDFALDFVPKKKELCLKRIAHDKVCQFSYQPQGQWFSPGTPASAR